MNSNERDTRIAEIDYYLRNQNISLPERIIEVRKQLYPDIDIDYLIDNFSIDCIEQISEYSKIDEWYQKNYDNNKFFHYFNIKEKPFYFQGDIYYFKYPVEFNCCQIVDCTTLPQIIKENLTEAETEYLENLFKSGIKQLQAVKSLEEVVLFRDKRKNNADFFISLISEELQKVFYLHAETIKFIRFAIEDLNLAIITLKNTKDYQFVIFPASQAIEKLLKACLIQEKLKQLAPQEIQEELKNKYGHKLFNILKELECYVETTSKIVYEVKKFPQSEEIFVKKPNLNPRYDEITVSSKQAVEIINATLNIFELVSKTFYSSLERAMHYPQLEEGYDTYFNQSLEEDDFAFEE